MAVLTACLVVGAAGLSTAEAEAAGGARSEAASSAPADAAAPAAPAEPTLAADAAGTTAGAQAMAQFLDRLMMAESGGRDQARNPRSTAVGAFQFIESTFIEVARRYFSAETAKLERAQILALRTNRAFARRAAEAYTRENAGLLVGAGLAATYANLRLAFLLGPSGAIRVLKAEPTTPAIRIVGAGVVQANPFMAGKTAADLATWSARNLAASSLAGREVRGVKPVALAARAAPAINVRCSRARPSCRRWVALATRRVKSRVADSTSSRRGR